MSRSVASKAIAALRMEVTGAFLRSRAASPRGTLLRSAAPCSLLRSACSPTVVPAQLLPRLWLGGGAHPVGHRVGTDALALSAVGLGTRSSWGGVSRRALSGSRGGASNGEGAVSRDGSGGGGSTAGKLNREITQCRDVKGLLGLVKQHRESFDFIHVSSMWVALVKMQVGGRGEEGEVIQLLQVLTRERVATMKAQAVANTLHSIVTLHESGRMSVDDELEGKLLTRAKAMARDFKPQGIVNVMWAMSTMGIENPDAGLVKAMQGRAMMVVDDFKPQGVAMLMLAFAKMGITPDAGLRKAMQGQAIATTGDFTPQNIANLMWALATMGITPGAGLLEAMEGQAVATAGNFKPQEVVNLMWALATMGIRPDVDLLEAMEGQAVATARDFKPQGIANLMVALEKMGIRPDVDLLEAMEGQAIATAGGFKLQDVQMLMGALKKMGITPDAGLAVAMKGRGR